MTQAPTMKKKKQLNNVTMLPTAKLPKLTFVFMVLLYRVTSGVLTTNNTNFGERSLR